MKNKNIVLTMDEWQGPLSCGPVDLDMNSDRNKRLLTQESKQTFNRRIYPKKITRTSVFGGRNTGRQISVISLNMS